MAASAAQVLANLGPLIEIGCGCGYWARLLRERGIDVLAFDHKLPPQKQRWTELKQGGPEVLVGPNSARTLMLCYPDDFEDSDDSMAVRCLRNYTGDTVVHIGEMLGETYCLPSPWGRTSDAEFQVNIIIISHVSSAPIRLDDHAFSVVTTAGSTSDHLPQGAGGPAAFVALLTRQPHSLEANHNLHCRWPDVRVRAGRRKVAAKCWCRSTIDGTPPVDQTRWLRHRKDICRRSRCTQPRLDSFLQLKQ